MTSDEEPLPPDAPTGEPAPKPVEVRLAPATAEALQPLATLVARGEIATLDDGPAVALRLDAAQPTPGDCDHLESWPDARRLVFPVGDAGLDLVLLREDGGASRLEGWTTAPGQGVLLERGVWHGGPWPRRGHELIEVTADGGVVDHIDQESLRVLVGSPAARIVDPTAPPPRPEDLARPLPTYGSLEVASALASRVRVGAFEIVGPDLIPPSESTLARLRSWSACSDLDHRDLRATALAAGLGLAHPAGTLRAQALRGVRSGLFPRTALEARLWEVALEFEVDLMAASIGRVVAPYRLRSGRSWESAFRPSGHEMNLDGSWVLQAGGRLLATQEGPLRAGRLDPRTPHALVLVLLPRRMPDDEALARLSVVSSAFPRLGRDAGRAAGFAR